MRSTLGVRSLDAKDRGPPRQLCPALGVLSASHPAAPAARPAGRGPLRRGTFVTGKQMFPLSFCPQIAASLLLKDSQKSDHDLAWKPPTLELLVHSFTTV